MDEDFDIGEYELWLQDAGPRHAAVMQALRKLQPELGLQEALERVRSTPYRLGEYVSYSEVMAARRRLEAVGAAVEVHPLRLLFPAGVLDQEPGDFDRYLNRFYSSHLRAIDEPALAGWAKQAGIFEAYRFLYFPTFDPVVVVRVRSPSPVGGPWWAVAKLGTGLGGYAPGPVARSAEWALADSEVDWLQATLAATAFWEASWSRELWIDGQRCGVLDGSQWIIEGWRNGRYQLQSAQSPVDCPSFAAAEQLGSRFFELLGERLGPFEIY